MSCLINAFSRLHCYIENLIINNTGYTPQWQFCSSSPHSNRLKQIKTVQFILIISNCQVGLLVTFLSCSFLAPPPPWLFVKLFFWLDRCFSPTTFWKIRNETFNERISTYPFFMLRIVLFISFCSLKKVLCANLSNIQLHLPFLPSFLSLKIKWRAIKPGCYIWGI